MLSIILMLVLPEPSCLDSFTNEMESELPEETLRQKIKHQNGHNRNNR